MKKTQTCLCPLLLRSWWSWSRVTVFWWWAERRAVGRPPRSLSLFWTTTSAEEWAPRVGWFAHSHDVSAPSLYVPAAAALWCFLNCYMWLHSVCVCVSLRWQNVWLQREQRVWGMETPVGTRSVCRGTKVWRNRVLITTVTVLQLTLNNEGIVLYLYKCFCLL